MLDQITDDHVDESDFGEQIGLAKARVKAARRVLAEAQGFAAGPPLLQESRLLPGLRQRPPTPTATSPEMHRPARARPTPAPSCRVPRRPLVDGRLPGVLDRAVFRTILTDPVTAS